MIHYFRYLFVKMKVFNYSELHFFKGTFYKTHTLDIGRLNRVALQIHKIEAALKCTSVDLKPPNVHADLTIYDREFHHQTDSNSSLPVVFYGSLGWPGLAWVGLGRLRAGSM